MTLCWKLRKDIPTIGDLSIVSTQEYLGALSDLTGEVGRLAVVCASARDIAAVKEIYEANLVISSMLCELNVGNKYGRKLDAVYANLKKVGDLIYELSLLRNSGRKSRTAFSSAENEEKGRTAGTETENVEDT